MERTVLHESSPYIFIISNIFICFICCVILLKLNYLLNKEVVPKTIAVLNYTRSGQKTTTMDEYGSWSQYKNFGAASVLASFNLIEEREEEGKLTEEDIEQIQENVCGNAAGR